ncbi:hypothetical protein [Umezawaea tangerina]|uniref:Uncharacterized protein n=1 Tax=Umezawaea tangerina TaxID=84725 RepID=A0A2T0SX96_9PSEU|nr:hypothetical protein [Umezawaea tangerina]PRY37973.1 hypothetical protein CLV43_109193 [Umezawaea tangerina]
MATSSYLGSTRNIVGCVGGLLGLGLHFAGVAGTYWLAVVVGLYGVGALLAPPDRVTLVTDPTQDAERLRQDLEALVAHVRTARVPSEALPRLDRVADVLRGLLDRPHDLRADPDAMHTATRVIGTDLPLAVQTYLAMPWWYAAARNADSELLRQLDLLAADVVRTAEGFHSADARRQTDHTRYLEDRDR